MVSSRPAVIGNRIVLIGALVYLFEWVAIIPAGNIGPSEHGGLSPAKLDGLYGHDLLFQAILVSWLSLVLIGRIAISVGLRRAVRQSSRAGGLAEIGIFAMALSVVFEVTAYAVVGAGAFLAADGADASVVATLDAIAGWIHLMVWAPLGASVLLGSMDMLRSRFFPVWMSWLGLLSGVLLVLLGVVSGPAYATGGTWRAILAPMQVGALLFWIWMLSTGVFLWLKTPTVAGPERPESRTTSAPPRPAAPSTQQR